jgi:hypothetical protein
MLRRTSRTPPVALECRVDPKTNAVVPLDRTGVILTCDHESAIVGTVAYAPGLRGGPWDLRCFDDGRHNMGCFGYWCLSGRKSSWDLRCRFTSKLRLNKRSNIHRPTLILPCRAIVRATQTHGRSVFLVRYKLTLDRLTHYDDIPMLHKPFLVEKLDRTFH